MSILNPNQDAAALKPLVDAAIQQAANDLATQIAPAFGAALKGALIDALSGLTVTVNITTSRKPPISGGGH